MNYRQAIRADCIIQKEKYLFLIILVWVRALLSASKLNFEADRLDVMRRLVSHSQKPLIIAMLFGHDLKKIVISLALKCQVFN